MRLLTGTLIAAALLGTAASAQPTLVADTQYMEASRCRGLAEPLGADTASLDAFLKAQSATRASYVLDRADQMRQDAKRQARRAQGDVKARLTAEWTGICANYKG